MRPRKYHITLAEDEYQYLKELTSKGTASAQKIKHAQIILKLDETFNHKPWALEKYAKHMGLVMAQFVV